MQLDDNICNSGEQRQRKYLSIHNAFYAQAESVAWAKYAVNILQILFLAIQTGLWETLLIKKTISSCLPARVQSVQKFTAGLKGGTYNQEVKHSAAKHMKRWTSQDKISEMNEWHRAEILFC